MIIDLKLGKFTHTDAGQMHLYLNYAREHWMQGGENPPVGMILCSQKDEAVARYALDGLPNKVMAAEYRTTLPDQDLLASNIVRIRAAIRSGVPTVTVRVRPLLLLPTDNPQPPPRRRTGKRTNRAKYASTGRRSRQARQPL